VRKPVYNLVFPSRCHAMTIFGYRFSRVENYRDQLVSLQHLVPSNAVSKLVGFLTPFRPESGRLRPGRLNRRVLNHSQASRKTCAGLVRSGWLRPHPARLPDRESRAGRTHRRIVPRGVVCWEFREAVVQSGDAAVPPERVLDQRPRNRRLAVSAGILLHYSLMSGADLLPCAGIGTAWNDAPRSCGS
jgi:hypothetical protein